MSVEVIFHFSQLSFSSKFLSRPLIKAKPDICGVRHLDYKDNWTILYPKFLFLSVPVGLIKSCLFNSSKCRKQQDWRYFCLSWFSHTVTLKMVGWKSLETCRCIYNKFVIWKTTTILTLYARANVFTNNYISNITEWKL